MPEVQRLVVGAALTVVPLAEPHLPLLESIPDELEVVPEELDAVPELELVEPEMVPELDDVELIEQMVGSVPAVAITAAPASASGAP